MQSFIASLIIIAPLKKSYGSNFRNIKFRSLFIS
jgi:hypothetical protein